MACKQINIRVRNCVIEVFDVCNGGSEITYFSSVALATDKKIILNKQSGGTEQFLVADISLPSLGSGTDIAEQLNGMLAECNGTTLEMPKKLEQTITATHVDDPKTPVTLYLFSNPNCVTTDIEGMNVVDTNDYIMGNIAGTVIPQNLAKLTTPACKVICLGPGETIDYQGILDAVVADGVLLPNGTAPTGLLNPTVMVFQIGQIAYDATGAPKKVGAQYIDLNGEPINASSTWCPPKQIEIDEDCDGFLVGEDLTTVITNQSATEDTAFRFCADFIPLDTDDSDKDVQ